MYKPLFVAMTLAAGMLATATGDRGASAATPLIVVIKDYQFSPATVTIAPGTTVTWINEDESPHTIMERGRSFRSAALDTNDRFSHTFMQPGEFDYYCTLHPMMVGTIVVRPAGSSL
jgi:plastocyanin